VVTGGRGIFLHANMAVSCILASYFANCDSQSDVLEHSRNQGSIPEAMELLYKQKFKMAANVAA